MTSVAVNSSTLPVSIGLKIKKLRQAAGQSQTDLGEVLGVTFQQIQKYEKGMNTISAEKLFIISRWYDVDISSFFEDVKQIADTSTRSEHRLRLEIGKVATHMSEKMLRGVLNLMHGFVEEGKTI